MSFSKENPADIYHCVFAGNETFERLATFGLLANFMVYLMRVFHLEQVTAANVLNIWSGVTNFAPLVGAFISDAYVGRFKTIAFASCAAFLVHFSHHFTPLSVHTVISSYSKIKIVFIIWLLHWCICLCAVLISAITNEKEIYSFMYEIFLDFFKRKIYPFRGIMEPPYLWFRLVFMIINDLLQEYIVSNVVWLLSILYEITFCTLIYQYLQWRMILRNSKVYS